MDIEKLYPEVTNFNLNASHSGSGLFVTAEAYRSKNQQNNLIKFSVERRNKSKNAFNLNLL